MTTNNPLKRNAFLKHGLLLMAICTMLLSASAQAQTPGPPDLKNATPGPDGVYNIVEVLPKFPGGIQAFSSFLAKNIRYPAADRENNIQGKAVTQFVVETDGSLSNFTTERSPSDAMAQEAIRVLSSSPKWVPGQQNGKVVRARYTMPINFTLGK